MLKLMQSVKSWPPSPLRDFAFPTPAAAFRRSISAVSSSPSSGWTSLAAGNTVAQDWVSHWYGRSPTSTAAPFGWRRVRRRAPPLRWGCQRNNQRSPKTLLFVFRRFARRAAAFLSVWGGQPEREASLFNLKFLAARVRVYVRQLADGVGMNATFLLSISSFIKLPTLEKCEHKNSFIHILLYKFVAQFRVQIIP